MNTETLERIIYFWTQYKDLFQWVFVIVVAVLVFSFERKTKEKQRQIFQELALLHNGQIIKKRFFDSPQVKFPYLDKEITISYGSRGEHDRSETILQYPMSSASHYWLTLNFGASLNSLGKLFGLKYLLIGNQEFDSVYRINTNDELKTRNFLSYDIQFKLLELKDIKPTLVISDKKFIFTVFKEFRTLDEYRPFVEAGLTFVRKLKTVL